MILPAQPAAPPPVVRHMFAQGTEGWITLGEIAKVDRAELPAEGKVPAGPALRFEYSVDNRSLNLLVLPVAPQSWSRASGLSFAIKSSATTTLAVAVQEKGGGRWSAIVHCAEPGWQEIRLSGSDFQRSRDTGAPDDPDDRLDLGAVEQLTILDFAQVAIRAEGPLKSLFPAEPGLRTLWLRAFTVESEAPDLDSLAAPQLGWLPLGGAIVTRVPADLSPLGIVSLQARVSIGPGKIAGLMRPLPEALLAGAKGIRMRFASTDALPLLVQFEDAAGGKFNTTVDIPAGKVAKTIDIDFATLTKSGDSKTDRLDSKRIRQIMLLDPSGIIDGAERSRTIWTAGWEAR